jgi:hypothetical protein
VPFPENPQQMYGNNTSAKIFGDSSFGVAKIFHAIDIPHEIRPHSRKFKLFHDIG